MIEAILEYFLNWIAVTPPLDLLAQIVIIFTGIFSVFWMSSPEARVRRNGAAIGLFGEPFWLTTAIINGQPGVIVLVIIFGINWSRAFYVNYKLVKKEEEENE